MNTRVIETKDFATSKIARKSLSGIHKIHQHFPFVFHLDVTAEGAIKSVFNQVVGSTRDIYLAAFTIRAAVFTVSPQMS
jgi:hypothetical protein